METAAILALVAVCGYFVIRKMAKDLGLGRRNSNSGCGCGSCSSKKRGIS